MTIPGYYYLVVSLLTIVLGAMVIARVARAGPLSRLIMLIVGGGVAVLILMALAWVVLVNLGTTE